MTSFADVLQAIKGPRGTFPMTAAEIAQRIEGKRGSGLFTDAEINTMLELFRAMPENTVFRNPAKIAEALNAAHVGIAMTSAYKGREEDLAVVERDNRAPLGKGAVLGDIGLAEEIRREHQDVLGQVGAGGGEVVRPDQPARNTLAKSRGTQQGEQGQRRGQR